ncbi:MAG: hypothetical protein HGA87_02675 [Desulfobulbaceae bacterium]|nr:hypothetical protein [Desulfobulbaceae bacterium]
MTEITATFMQVLGEFIAVCICGAGSYLVIKSVVGPQRKRYNSGEQ